MRIHSTFYSSYLTASRLFALDSFFIFIGLIKVVEYRHAPWNPNDQICPDLKQASKPYTLVQPE